MFWILLILGIVGYIIYMFTRDRDHMLQRQVDMHGGMVNKYQYLVKCFTDHPTAKIVRLRRDHIYIRATGETTAYNFLITETFNKVVIKWVGQMGIYGTHEHKWSFPHNYPQEKIVKEIEDYLIWKSNEMFGSDI